MELYWKLASGDASVREEAAVALVRDLLQSQQQQEKGAHVHKEEGDAAHHHQSSNNYHQAAEEVLLGASAEDEGLRNCTPAVQYALRRLVRGVASSRESARQGFAMALASVLEALPLVRVDYVLKLIKKSLEVTSSMKGQEKRDGLLGQLFALGAVVRSGRLVADDEDTKHANLARDIAEQLLSLANKKVFLREPAITLLLHLIDKLPPSLLQDSVLSSSLLQETLCVDINNGSADSLLLALRLQEQLPTSVVESCPLLPNSRSTHALFEPSHLLSLLPVLKDSSSCHPRVHPVWSTLIELLFLDSNAEGRRQTPSKKKKRRKMERNEAVETVDQRVVSFWTLVVDKSLLTSSHERKYLAMELLQLVLARLSAQSSGFVLSRTLVRCVLDILADKGNLLYKSAQRCLEFICEWAKADEQCLVAVILSLQQGSHGKFDTLSKTQTVKQLVAMLKSKEVCFLLYDKLVELFNGGKSASFAAPQLQLLSNGTDDQYGPERDDRKEQEKLGTDGVKSGEFQRYWVLDQICSFVKQIHVESELRVSLQKEVLKFLTVNALFVGSSGVKCTVQGLQEEVKFPEVPIPENIRKLCLARLQSVLVDVLPTASLVKDNTNTAGKDELVQKTSGSSDLRFFFLELCDMLDKIPRVTRVQPVSEDDKDAINALRSCVSQLYAVIQKAENEKSQKIQAMCSLLMQLLLQSVTAAHVNEIAAELIICCERVFGELIEVDAKGDDQEEEDSPVFMDVLVDILLSLLAQASAPIRAAAEQVFKSFCGDLTESAMLSLLRVVKKQLRSARRMAATPLDVGDSDEDQFLEVEDSDEDMNDDDDHVNMDDNTEKPEGKELHTLDSDTDDDVKGGEGNQSQNNHDSETSKDNSDSDMDDEAMFRIDTHLANLLKQKGAVGDKGEGKDAQTQLQHFKFRVLSLVEYFFQKKSSSHLCLTALPHLLQAFVFSCSVGGNSQLAGRIGSILQMKLFKSKQYPKGEEVDKASVECFLQRCVKLVSRSKVKKVREVAQSCSLWLVKVLHGQPLQEGDERENLRGIIQDAMNDFFSQKKSHLKAPFFRELFMRFPGLGMANLGLLLDRCVNSRSEYLQHEALLLVNFILQFNTGKESGQFRECLMQHLPALSGVLVGLIEKPPSKGPRKSEARRFCLSLLKVVSQELPEKPVKKLIGKPAYNLCLSHLGATVVEDILKSQVVSGVPDSQNARDASKRLSKQKSGHK